MLIDNIIYEQKYNFTISQYEGPFFYYFDWDERSYQINMEFQHFHQYYEMCIFLDEQAGHLINGAWNDMRCGDIVAIRPSLLHRTSYPEGAPNKRLIIQFAFPNMPAPLDSYMKKILSIFTKEVPIYRFEGKYKNIILEKLNDIYYLSKTPNEMTDLAIHNKLTSPAHKGRGNILLQIYIQAGIHIDAIQRDSKVQMVSGGNSGASGQANLLTSADNSAIADAESA